MRVLVCAGGTGGHIYPALSVTSRLREQGVADEAFLWVGTGGQMEELLVPRAGLKLETINGGPIVGVSVRTKLMNGVKLMWSLGRSWRLFSRFRPDVLFMTGGYVNVPVALVGRVRHVPSAIFLPDVEPGTAIRFLSRIVDCVACSVPPSTNFFVRDKTIVTGYPVRPEIRAALKMGKEEALAEFGLRAEYPTVLVFGGSRGARSINRALMATLSRLLEEAVQVIHISGTLDWPTVEANAAGLAEAARRLYRPYPYLHEPMGTAFRAADLVIARAGASMLGEAPAFGLPSVLVPYPFAWRYQKVNADYLVEKGAAIHIPDERLADELLPTVLALLGDKVRLEQMGAAAANLDVPDAAGNLARLLSRLGRIRDA